jgi:uncharacterized membrane protein
MQNIEAAVRECEQSTSGEICVTVEPALHLGRLLRGQTARERALEVFAQLHVWDTAQNNGVLIYLLLADRDVEIVADRGIDAKVGAEGWQRICAQMEAAFAAGRYAQGLVDGVHAVGAELGAHFPLGPEHGDRDELANRPIVL